MRGFAIHGTPEYMAPEQVAGEAVDRRTDLYALGCVLYEMLTGVRAFDGPSSVVVMGKQLRETPEPPRTRSSQPIPRDVEAVVVRAMAKRPEDRFASAAAMRAALERALARPARQRERIRRVATGVLSAAAMLAAAAGASTWERMRGSALREACATCTTSPAPAPRPALAEAAEGTGAGMPPNLMAASAEPAVLMAPMAWESPRTVDRGAEHAGDRLAGAHGRAEQAHASETHRKLGAGGSGSVGVASSTSGNVQTQSRYGSERGEKDKTDGSRWSKIAVTP